AIRKAADNAERLLLAVGVDEIRAHLPRATIDTVEAMEGPLDNRAVAELAFVIHGTGALKEHSDALEDRGLESPQRWSGSRAAVTFVRELGFGVEFAGFESQKIDRLIEVEG